MNNTTINKGIFKKLTFFISASLSLVATGFMQYLCLTWECVISLSLVTVLGVFLVYRFNDLVDSKDSLSIKLAEFFHYPSHVIASLGVVFLTPLVIYSLPPFSFVLLAIVAFVGFLYSIKVKMPHVNFRLKNMFLVKNILIGISWGALVLIGAGGYDYNLIILFTFVSIQVFIGSMIRDIADKEKDASQNVRTLPVVYGENKTVLFMHVINLLSMLLLTINSSEELVFVILSVAIWRGITLYFIGKNYLSAFWGQKANLFTCNLIFIVLYIQNYVV